LHFREKGEGTVHGYVSQQDSLKTMTFRLVKSDPSYSLNHFSSVSFLSIFWLYDDADAKLTNV
jgi:hypothetical protein